MSQAKESPAADEQYYRLAEEFTVMNPPGKRGSEVFEKGEKFWWNGVHFVACQDGAKVSRSILNKLKNRMIPINPDGSDVDLS